MASAPSLVQGRIIWARIADRGGVNPKIRPAVLLLGADAVPPGEPLLAAVITTTYPKPLPPYHVELPWNRDRRRVLTQLTAPSAVVCDWLVTVERDSVQRVGGLVPPSKMKAIITLVASLKPPP